jgi:hypothetical protein
MNRTIGSVISVVGRSRTAGLVLATTGLVVVGLSASAVPASARPTVPHAAIGSFSFAAGPAHLSGGGHNWSVEISVEAFGSPNFNAIGFGITTSHLGGAENHSWGGTLGRGDLSVSSAAVMTINSRSSLSPVASLNLTFRPASHKTETANCLTGSELVYTGALKGSVRLTTGLKRLKLNGAHVSFGSHDTLTVLNTCALAPCRLSSWDASTSSSNNAATASGDSFVEPGHAMSTVFIDRFVTLPGANKLVRGDTWTMTTRAPHFTKSSKSLSVSTSSSGLITGAATLAHGKPSGSEGAPKTCKVDGTEYSQSETEYMDARYEQSRPFEAHTILNGIVKVKPSGPADFDIITLKRK